MSIAIGILAESSRIIEYFSQRTIEVPAATGQRANLVELRRHAGCERRAVGVLGTSGVRHREHTKPDLAEAEHPRGAFLAVGTAQAAIAFPVSFLQVTVGLPPGGRGQIYLG